MKIAFIGLGNMGAPMARNLIKAGHSLNLVDLNKTVLAELEQLGGSISASAREAAEGAELVITMLPAAVHVRSVWLGEDGVLAGIGKGVPAVDCSTIDPQTARDVAAAAAKQGVAVADAPVSGGTGGAAAGTLTFMVGATPELFATLQPVLAQMGRNIVHCGEVGTGQIAKICNNLLLGISMVGVSEAMALGDALGIDTERVGRHHQQLHRTLLEFGDVQPVAGHRRNGTGLARLYRWLRRRIDAQGSGAGHGSGTSGAPAGGAWRGGATVVSGDEPAWGRRQ